MPASRTPCWHSEICNSPMYNPVDGHLKSWYNPHVLFDDGTLWYLFLESPTESTTFKNGALLAQAGVSRTSLCFKVSTFPRKSLPSPRLRWEPPGGCTKTFTFPSLFVHLKIVKMNTIWKHVGWTNISCCCILVEPIHTIKAKGITPNAGSLNELQSLLQMSWQGNG